MLKNFDLQDIRIRAAVIRPHVLLPEAHPVKRNRRQPVAHLRELLGIREAAAQPLDLADMAANVERGADVAERRSVAHLDPFSHYELRPHRFCTSSILRPSSSVVMRPRWISVCVSEVIHFS